MGSKATQYKQICLSIRPFSFVTILLIWHPLHSKNIGNHNINQQMPKQTTFVVNRGKKCMHNYLTRLDQNLMS